MDKGSESTKARTLVLLNFDNGNIVVGCAHHILFFACFFQNGGR